MTKNFNVYSYFVLFVIIFTILQILLYIFAQLNAAGEHRLLSKTFQKSYRPFGQ